MLIIIQCIYTYCIIDIQVQQFLVCLDERFFLYEFIIYFKF